MEGHLDACHRATPQTALPESIITTPSPLLPPSTVSPSPGSMGPPPQQDTTALAVSSSQLIQASALHSSADTHVTHAHFELHSTTTASSIVSSSAAIYSSVVPINQENKSQRLKKVQCPHCKIFIYKKNIAKHIHRKHEIKSKDITESHHLHNVCVNATNGISAIQKATHGFSVLIHVQNKTWVICTKISVSWKNAGRMV